MIKLDNRHRSWDDLPKASTLERDIAEAVHNAMILYSVHSEDVYLDLLTVANPQEVSYSFFVSRDRTCYKRGDL